jgi:hypothetical protein
LISGDKLCKKPLLKLRQRTYNIFWIEIN